MKRCDGCEAPIPSGTKRRWCSRRCLRRKYADPCAGCGKTLFSERADVDPFRRCGACSTAYSRTPQALAAVERREAIAAGWADGKKLAEIAAEMGSSVGSVQVTVHRMRAAGWDVPYRHPMLTKEVAA